MAAKKESRPSRPLYVVRLTPGGTGAVAVVLVDGPRATEAVSACFAPHSGRQLHNVPTGRIVLGRWGGPEGEELIVCRRGPDRVEVHPHGGRAAVERIIGDLVQQDAVEIPWKDWIAADEEGSVRAAARIALADAPTQRTAAVLLDQFHGALRRDLETAVTLLSAGDTRRGEEVLAKLAGRCEFGRHLTTPWRVVLAGPPNVGKSSLINALVGYQRAVVYDLPGTTRDVVTARTAIDGWPVELSDTAGLRTSSDPLEAEGVLLAERLLSKADLVVYVLDATWSAEVLETQLRSIDGPRRVIVAMNKVDLVDHSRREALAAASEVLAGRACLTSAIAKDGTRELLQRVATLLVPSPPACGEAVPFEASQCRAIDAALELVSNGDVSSAISVLQALI